MTTKRDEIMSTEEKDELRPDWTQKCEVCGARPIVPCTDLCGPCTWGEADTRYGGWWDDQADEPA